MRVRTRFAPSPTGALHVGGIRTALFAWLVARQAGGDFILRIEDTDKKREQAGAEEQIIASLKSLGLDYDEGPDSGGPHAPYRQSQRLDIYKKWGQRLIDAGRAYADPYSPEQVQAFRDSAQQAKKAFLYREHRPDNPPPWDGRRPLRFKSEPKAYKWVDEVMGELSAGPEAIDDFVLIKSDGFPTYNFSHVVDDAEMLISHVIRGQEFLSSVPNYLNLYEALGIDRPRLATMPHILGPDGRKKLSKRDGAKDVLEYVKEGYLPEALVSFIATMGWNDGSQQEIFTIDELIQKFDLGRVQKSGAKFDEARLKWTNGHFIREMPLERLYGLAGPFWPKEAKEYDDQYKKAVLALLQERLKYLAELPELSSFFFARDLKRLPASPDDRRFEDVLPQNNKEMVKKVAEELQNSDFSVEDLKTRLNGLLMKLDTSPKVLFSVVRIATTQAPVSPDLFGTLHVLGRDLSLKRLNDSIS